MFNMIKKLKVATNTTNVISKAFIRARIREFWNQYTHISFIKISSLNHEIFNDTMKSRTFIPETLFA